MKKLILSIHCKALQKKKKEDESGKIVRVANDPALCVGLKAVGFDEWEDYICRLIFTQQKSVFVNINKKLAK